MQFGYIPKINLPADIKDTQLSTFNSPIRLKSMGESPEVPKFTDVVSNLAKELDQTAKAPDQVLKDAVTGNGADIHDVMIAMSKAELGVNIATQITTKVVQSY